MRGYVSTSIGQMHYLQEGKSGPDIVLFHDHNFSSNLYSHILPLLGERYRAWAFDSPGVGRSDSPEEDLTFLNTVGWLGEAMDAVGIERAVIGGLHTGSRIAFEMTRLRGADRYPAIIATGIGPLTATGFTDTKFPHLNFPPDKEGTQWQRAIARYRALFPTQVPPTEENAWIQHLYALASLDKAVPDRFGWPGALEADWELASVLENFPKSVLILTSPEDCFFEGDQQLAKSIPNARLKVLEGIGPHLMLRDPEAYVREIFSFLDEIGVQT